jgi:hypothetical protein
LLAAAALEVAQQLEVLFGPQLEHRKSLHTKSFIKSLSGSEAVDIKVVVAPLRQTVPDDSILQVFVVSLASIEKEVIAGGWLNTTLLLVAKCQG